MALITFTFFLQFIVIGCGVIAQLSSTEHNPPVTEDVKEHEEPFTSSISPVVTIALVSSTEKTPEEPATSSSKEETVKASDFSPSEYLGEIKEIESHSRRSTSIPFNNVQHVRFEGSIGLDGNSGVSYRQQPFHSEHHHYQTDHRQGESHTPPSAYAEGYLTVEMPTKPMYYPSEESNQLVTVEIPQQAYQHVQPVPAHQYHHQPMQSPDHQSIPQAHQTHQIHQNPQHYQIQQTYQTPQNQHSAVKYEYHPVPYQHHVHHEHHVPPMTSYYHYKGQLPVSRPEVTLTKPDTLLYLSSHRETSLMKTRKSPYKYYQPNDDIPMHYIEQGHAFPAHHTRVSPWKKLIHLIGAFLPFGLLLAALRPNVRIEPSNTTQPNIVLSKWRGIDLPLEHKEDVDDVCEDKTLCEIILSGSKENAELVNSILWNFAIKSTEEEALRNGLQEIFNAVKKKNCSLIKC